MKNIWNKFLVCGAVFVALTAGAAERPAAMVKVGKSVGVKQSVSKKYIGNISGVDDVSLMPRVSGIILEQCFNNGDMVKKGQLLFQLEDTTYRAQRDAAKAKLEQCRAEYAFAKKTLERISSLWKSKAASESSYDDAVRMEAAGRAAVSAAEAALLDAENQLSYTKIYAPFDGKAGKAAVSPFNYVTPATGALVSVVRLDQLYVNFWVSSRDYLTMFGSYDELVKNADIRISLADDSIYPEAAKVVFLDNRIDKDTDTIRIRGLVNNKDFKLIPDSLVTVILSRKESKNVPAVPSSAVMNDGKKDYVYVLNADNTVSLRPVITGELQGNMQIIAKGLKVGETVVVEGVHKVIPDGKHKVVPVTANPGE